MPVEDGPPQLPAGGPEPEPDVGSSTPPPADKPKAKRKRRKAKADTPPRPQKSGAAKRSERKASEIARIESFFAKVLSMPAGAMMIRGDTWGFQHFTTQGPAVAKAIAEECEENAAMRRYALQIVEWFSAVTLAGALAAYLLPVLMHFGIVPGAQVFGVPVVANRPRPAGPASGAAGSNGEGPVPPFMGGHEAPPPPPPPEPEPTGDPLADELAGVAPPPPVDAV